MYAHGSGAEKILAQLLSVNEQARSCRFVYQTVAAGVVWYKLMPDGIWYRPLTSPELKCSNFNQHRRVLATNPTVRSHSRQRDHLCDTGQRSYAFVGDIVWQLEGITERGERPWITRRKADTDAEAYRENLLRMISLKERLPDLVIVPAHDMRVFAAMPKISQSISTTAASP